MKKILEDYIEYLKIPKWDKKNKNLKNQILHNWYKREYKESVNYEELKEFEIFAEQNGFHYKTHFFYEKVEFNIYYYEFVEKGNLELLKILYKTRGKVLYNQKTGIEIDLIKLGLQIDENDKELLKEKLKEKLAFLRLTIHEVPWIVIAGANSASIEETRKLFEILEETIRLSESLNEKIDKELINNCVFYWNNWINFLQNISDYTNFEEYLKENKNSR